MLTKDVILWYDNMQYSCDMICSQVTSPMHKKLSLEMGGKNACIVFPTADLSAAIGTIVRLVHIDWLQSSIAISLYFLFAVYFFSSCFANQGEICLCTSRLFVHQSIFDDFMKQFAEVSDKLTVGAPNTLVDLGPLVSRQHFDKVTHYLKLAKQNNTTFLCGAGDLQLDGKNKNVSRNCAEY